MATKKTETQKRFLALQETAVDLMSSRDLSTTLHTILQKALDLLYADAGSLYLKSKEEGHITFEVALNRSLQVPFKKFSIPTTDRGLAVYVYKNGTPLNIPDVDKISEHLPYSFNKSFDQMYSYKTKSALTIPLKSTKGQVLGVLQVLNRKRSNKTPWPSHKPLLIKKMPAFSKDDEALLTSFAGIASAAIENALLYQDIENLFEGFVKASVQAIEARDPATRGHSERVAALTTDLAEKSNRSNDFSLRDTRFSDEQIAELRYAALLHDFGKIGVREATLLKEEKLSPLQKLSIRSRFTDYKRLTEIRVLRDYIDRLIKNQSIPNEVEFARLKKQISEFGIKIDEAWAAIEELNKPSILTEDKGNKLMALSCLTCPDLKGDNKSLLLPDEVECLSIKKGSLSESERLEIESHVIHTVAFLEQIPWTQKYSKIPTIAGGHHERLTGKGYPYKLTAVDISNQARMMAICDIFDALVANDRPYKPALPTEKALSIIEAQVKSGDLDSRFFKVFLEGRVWETPGFVNYLSLSATKKAA